MIKELAKSFATLENFSDNVIAEIKFFRGKFKSGLKVLEENREFKLISSASADEKILVKLVAPRKKIRSAVGVRIQAEKKTQMIFTSDEVFDFVEEVRDKNKIYRLNPPIVPPLLVLETLLKIEQFSSCENLKLRFKHFITAGEPLTFYVADEKNFELQSAGSVKVLISVK